MPNLHRRLGKLEQTAAERQAVPYLVTLPEGTFAGSERMTLAEWLERYGSQIEEERRAGRLIFGIDFTHPGDTQPGLADAP